MTEVEQNMAIAECCGWSSVGVNPNLYSGQPFGMFDIKEHPELFDGQPWHTEGTGMGPIPNYVRSLDDMHVAEGFLTENQIRHYNGPRYTSSLDSISEVEKLLSSERPIVTSEFDIYTGDQLRVGASDRDVYFIHLRNMTGLYNHIDVFITATAAQRAEAILKTFGLGGDLPSYFPDANLTLA